MVSRKYLLDIPPRPSKPRAFFVQRLLPKLIDLAGCLESGLERVAIRTRRRPIPGLGLALGVGIVLSLLQREVRLRTKSDDIAGRPSGSGPTQLLGCRASRGSP